MKGYWGLGGPSPFVAKILLRGEAAWGVCWVNAETLKPESLGPATLKPWNLGQVTKHPCASGYKGTDPVGCSEKHT